jgi:hypothetical protein
VKVRKNTECSWAPTQSRERRDETPRFLLRLEVGQNSETVTVEVVAPFVDYSPGINNDMDQERIVEVGQPGVIGVFSSDAPE